MVPLSNLLLSQSEMDFIREGCRESCRTDGRSRTEYRSYAIIVSTEHERDNLPSSINTLSLSSPPLILSNGSARLISSDQQTHLLCSVKADVVKPSVNAPNEGVVEFFVDRVTTSAYSNKRSDDELQALCRSLLIEQLFDKKKLCILPNYYVWRLSIDLLLLSVSGSLLDAASHVIQAAIEHTVLPRVTTPSAAVSDSNTMLDQPDSATELVVDSDFSSAHCLRIDCTPVIATVTVMKCRDPHSNHPVFILIHDASAEEEACCHCQVHVAVNLSITDESPNDEHVLCGLQTLGSGSLPLSLLPDITASAIQAAKMARGAYRVVQSNTMSTSFLQEIFMLQ